MIEEIKKKIRELAEAKKRSEELLHQREIHENEMVALKQTFENEPRFLQLRQRIQNIDEQLDHLGEDHDSALTALNSALIEEIFQKNPTARKEYESFQQILRKKRRLKQEIEEIHEKIASLHEKLNAAAEVRELSKRRTLFVKLFSRHPQVVMAQYLAQAEKEAESLNCIVDKISSPEIAAFTNQFIEEVQRPWNRELYKNRIFELRKTLSNLMARKERERRVLEIEISHEQQALERWIDTL